MLVKKEKLIKEEEIKLDIRSALDKERSDYAYSLKRAGYFGNFLLEGRVTAIDDQEDRGIFSCKMTLEPMGSKWIDFAVAKYRPKLSEVFLIRAKDWNNSPKWHCFIWDEFSKKEVAKREKEEQLELKKNLNVYHVDYGHYDFLDEENKKLVRKVEIEGESETSKEKFESFIRRNKPLKRGDGRRHKILQRGQYETLGLFKNYFGFSCFEEQNIAPFLAARKVSLFRFKPRGLPSLKYCFPVFNRNVSFFLVKKFFGATKLRQTRRKLKIPTNLFMYQTIRFLPVYSFLQDMKICLTGTSRKRLMLNSLNTFRFMSDWLSWKFLFTFVTLFRNTDYKSSRRCAYSLSKISQLRSLLKINGAFSNGLLSTGYYDYLRKLISLPIQRPFDVFVIGCCVNPEENVAFSFSQFGYSHRFRTYFLEPRKRTAKPLSSIVNFKKFGLFGRSISFLRYSSKLWLSTSVYREMIKNSVALELAFGKTRNNLLRWVDPLAAVSNERFGSTMREEVRYIERLQNVIASTNNLLPRVANLFNRKYVRLPAIATKKKFKLSKESGLVFKNTFLKKFKNNHRQQLGDKFKNKFVNKLKDMPAYDFVTHLALSKRKLQSNRFEFDKKKLMVNRLKKKNILKYRTTTRGYSSLINPKACSSLSLRQPIRVSFNFLEESLLKNRGGSRLFPLRVFSKFFSEEKLACLNFVKLDSLSYLTKSPFPFKKRFIVSTSKKIWGKKRKTRSLIRRRSIYSPAKLSFFNSRLFLPWFGSGRSVSQGKSLLPTLVFSKSMYRDLVAKERVRLLVLKELQLGLKQSFMASEKWRKQNEQSSKYTTNPFWNNRTNSHNKHQHKWRDVTFGRIFVLELNRLLYSGVRVSPSIFFREQKRHIFKGDRGSYRTRFFFGKLALCFYQTFVSYKNLSGVGRSIPFMNYLRFQKLIDRLGTFKALSQAIDASKEIDKRNTKNWEAWNRIKQAWYAYKKQQRKQRKFNKAKFGKNNHKFGYKHANNSRHGNYRKNHSYHRGHYKNNQWGVDPKQPAWELGVSNSDFSKQGFKNKNFDNLNSGANPSFTQNLEFKVAHQKPDSRSKFNRRRKNLYSKDRGAFVSHNAAGNNIYNQNSNQAVIADKQGKKGANKNMHDSRTFSRNRTAETNYKPVSAVVKPRFDVKLNKQLVNLERQDTRKNLNKNEFKEGRNRSMGLSNLGGGKFIPNTNTKGFRVGGVQENRNKNKKRGKR